MVFNELLTDFSYTNFTVSYGDALDRLRTLSCLKDFQESALRLTSIETYIKYRQEHR